ncbi:exoribonuclease II [Vibrio rumoiensis]|uniref:Exoribonuclease 2 n=1 Tax=Vibrio rumoiensis 1S-45 TaxID=1188252 RepID=A0A1E5DZ87_9VIBR|nr:exoribonuclease II [Vibrio rumoiensis]OEF23148.1 exoribonuclease II [Vibrio rumoiensis 1S-45]
MFSDNPLLAQLKQQMKETLPKKEGTVKATDKSFGFLEVDSKTSYFIPPASMKKCIHGDKVIAIIRSENDKESAEPDELVEPALTRFVARVKKFKGRLNVVPDHPQLKKLSLKAKARKGVNPETLNEGDWVVAHLVEHPLMSDNTNDQFLAEISEKITDSDDKIAPWWVTLAQNDLPNCEPKGLENGEEWQLKDDEDLQRIDLTNTPFVTIDGESTKDMDDALYAEETDNGDFKLTIAIADPTAYITPDSDMDKVARKRGFTIYLPGRNIPMLPRDLADDLCSLKQDELRAALCCSVTVSKDGVIGSDIQFFAATIKSHARLAYDHVSDWLETGNSEVWQPSETIAKVVKTLHKFAQARSEWRINNAVVFPDRPDYRFELSDDNDVVAIHADMRRTANKLVEESMITANICAGTALKSKFNSGIFNTHAGFKEDKLKDVIELVNPDSELPFTVESISTLEGFSALRRWLAQQDARYIDNRIRKCQAYSEINHLPEAHYAMGLDIYATWTSPIRKYGDMINHRMLKALVLDKAPVQVPDESVGEELSLCRRYHGMAERNVGDWLYARTLINEPENGTLYQAEIFDINRAGARARLLENGAAVFIPCSQIIDNKERISASRELGTIEIDKNIEFKLGDTIEVSLVNVSLDNRNIIAKPTQTFAPLEEKVEANTQEISEE